MKTIKVTQTASEKFAPDTVVFELTLAVESKKYADAADKLRAMTTAVTQALKAAKLAKNELTSSGSAISSVHRDGKIVFHAHESMKISLSVGDCRLGDVAAALEESGAQWSQSYMLADKSHKMSLIEKAVKAAHEVAVTIASAANVKLGALSGVEYGAQYGGPRMFKAAAFSDSVEPEQITAEETVTCEWEIA